VLITPTSYMLTSFEFSLLNLGFTLRNMKISLPLSLFLFLALYFFISLFFFKLFTNGLRNVAQGFQRDFEESSKICN
jgi:hypothetical protein